MSCNKKMKLKKTKGKKSTKKLITINFLKEKMSQK